MQIRPLSALSDFVCEQLATELLEPSRLGEHAVRLVEGLSAADVERALRPEHRAIATLDLAVFEAGVVHSGIECPTSLSGLVDTFTGPEIPMLSYDLIVIKNPADDIRLFTAGDSARTERTFYREHKLVEDILGLAIRGVRDSIAMLEKGKADDAKAAINGVEHNLSAIIRTTRMLAGMPREHFNAFRKYLMPHPTRKLNGPSGAFSARVPTLEFLLRGHQLSQDYFDTVESNMPYVPKHDRALLMQAIDRAKAGGTLVDLWEKAGKPAALQERIDALGNFFNDFRKMHYHAVGKQLPSALTGGTPGTAGEVDPGEFLRSRMQANRYTR